MVLYIISLGLGDEKDITVRGLESVKKCSKLYLEYYTSVLGVDKASLEKFYGVPISLADRNMVESDAEESAIASSCTSSSAICRPDETADIEPGGSIYLRALTENVGFLVVGDALCATTHIDLILRARKLGITVEVIHNASVMSASASCGLPLYQFGYTVSIPFFTQEWKPSSFYDRIKYNRGGGMHTLCLLDIKVKEPDFESIFRGKGNRFLPPRFMTVNTAIEQLLEIERERKEGVVSEESFAVGMARLGQPTQRIVFGTLGALLRVDFGPPLHCLALCGEVNPLEREFLDLFGIDESVPILQISQDGDENDGSDSDVERDS